MKLRRKRPEKNADLGTKIQYFNQHPDVFVEECLGIKLSMYQKILLKYQFYFGKQPLYIHTARGARSRIIDIYERK